MQQSPSRQQQQRIEQLNNGYRSKAQSYGPRKRAQRSTKRAERQQGIASMEEELLHMIHTSGNDTANDSSLTPEQQLMIATYEGMIESLQSRIEAVLAGHTYISSAQECVETLVYDARTHEYLSTEHTVGGNALVASNRLAEIAAYDSFTYRCDLIKERSIPGI